MFRPYNLNEEKFVTVCKVIEANPECMEHDAKDFGGFTAFSKTMFGKKLGSLWFKDSYRFYRMMDYLLDLEVPPSAVLLMDDSVGFTWNLRHKVTIKNIDDYINSYLQFQNYIDSIQGFDLYTSVHQIMYGEDNSDINLCFQFIPGDKKNVIPDNRDNYFPFRFTKEYFNHLIPDMCYYGIYLYYGDGRGSTTYNAYCSFDWAGGSYKSFEKNLIRYGNERRAKENRLRGTEINYRAKPTRPVFVKPPPSFSKRDSALETINVFEIKHAAYAY